MAEIHVGPGLLDLACQSNQNIFSIFFNLCVIDVSICLLMTKKLVGLWQCFIFSDKQTVNN